MVYMKTQEQKLKEEFNSKVKYPSDIHIFIHEEGVMSFRTESYTFIKCGAFQVATCFNKQSR